MRRRYTIHQDGDLLVEECDESGAVREPEAVPESERLPFEVTIRAPEGALARERLVELLEAVLNLEQEGSDWAPAAGKRHRLPQA